ncbi:protein amnionless-like [Watersipora subatra]|uniref:protein amnionless-like n=1 Tax=Watersipora subatra TaxID=2589382 RepID=UPI00355BED2E
MKNFLYLSILCLYLGCARADQKRWTKTINYDDPDNWNGGGIFCSNDRKVFPKQLVASIFIQKNESLQELVLSDNMALTLGEGVVLSFNTQVLDSDTVALVSPTTEHASSVSQSSTAAPAKCSAQGREVEFQVEATSWFNPKSWMTEQVDKLGSQRFMLDMESVPCSEDRVVFPSQDTFLVDIARADISAASMLVHHAEYVSQTTFDEYWKGDVSRYEFVNRAQNPPVITGLSCGDDRTCDCQDRYTDKFRSLVCQYVTCKDSETLACKHPILPSLGQCCRLCGSKLTVNMSVSETPSFLNELHKVILKGLESYQEVRYTVGPPVNSAREIILLDGVGKDGSSSSAICDLRKLFLSNATTASFGVVGVTFERSDGIDNCLPVPGATTPQISPTNQPKWDTIIIGGAMGFVIVCVLVICLAVYCYRKKYSGNFKSDMELANVDNRTSQGFDNPVYDVPLPFEDSFTVTYDSGSDPVSGFENALYSPGTDSGVSVHSGEKKTPIEDPYAPIVKQGKKKSSKKEAKSTGFDNPVYSVGGAEDGKGSMVSVPLDEDNGGLPAYVEHDGTGFANPIATGLSEEMMAPPLPAKVPITTLQNNKGFDNPLYGGESEGFEGDAGVGEVIVHVAEPTKKKKQKKKAGGSAAKSSGGFDNPLYGQSDGQQENSEQDPAGEDKSNEKSNEE